MKQIIKSILIIILTAAILTSCIPAEYKKGVELNKYFPENILEIYDGAIVFYSNENDGEITIKAGSKDDVEDVIEFYQALFKDKDEIIITNEDTEKDNEFKAEGIIADEKIIFEIYIGDAREKYQEKVFNSQFEIIITPIDEKELKQIEQKVLIEGGIIAEFSEIIIDTVTKVDGDGIDIILSDDIPLANISIHVPPSAINGEIDFSVGYTKISAKSDLGNVSDIGIYIDTGGYNNFKVPIEITFTYKPSEDGKLPLPCYLEETNNKLIPVIVIEHNVENNTMTFITYHASIFTWINIKPIIELINENFEDQFEDKVADTDFRPSIDGFNEVNQGSASSSGGDCFGMAAFSRWYYLNKKGKNKPSENSPNLPLYTAFPSGKYGTRVRVGKKPDEIYLQDIIAAKAQSNLGDTASEIAQMLTVLNDGENGPDDRVSIFSIWGILNNFKQPVIVYLSDYMGDYIPDNMGDFKKIYIDRDKDNESAHAVVAYRAQIKGTMLNIYVYDPNYPGDDNKKISYNMLLNKFYYDGWMDIKCFSGGTFNYDGIFEDIYQDAIENFENTAVHLEITSHKSGETVDDSTTIIKGTVDSISSMGEQIVDIVRIVTTDGSVYSDFIPEGGNEFEIEIPLTFGENYFNINTIVIEEFETFSKEKILSNDMHQDFLINCTYIDDTKDIMNLPFKETMLSDEEIEKLNFLLNKYSYNIDNDYAYDNLNYYDLALYAFWYAEPDKMVDDYYYVTKLSVYEELFNSFGLSSTDINKVQDILSEQYELPDGNYGIPIHGGEYGNQSMILSVSAYDEYLKIIFEVVPDCPICPLWEDITEHVYGTAIFKATDNGNGYNLLIFETYESIAAPKLSSPGNAIEPGSTINTFTPELVWEESEGAEYYALAISKYPYGIENIIYNPQQVYGITHKIPEGILEDGEKYRWNMQSYVNGEWSEISDLLYFQTIISQELIKSDEIFKVLLVEPLEITLNADYTVGNIITMTFKIKNEGNKQVTLNELLIGGRFNEGTLPNDEYPDFTTKYNVKLEPSSTYVYTGDYKITENGKYHFFVAYYIESPTAQQRESLDENNWNTNIDLLSGLTIEDREVDIDVS